MNFQKQTAPFIRKETSVKRMMIDVLIALLPIVIFSISKFGMDVVVRLLLSSVIFLLGEVGSTLLRTKPHPSLKGRKERFMVRYKTLTINNVTAPLISAFLYTLMLPSNLSLYVVGVGALFGILVVKAFFGGLGSNIFNPAATARVFVSLSFPSAFIYSGVDATLGATPLAAAKDALLNIPTLLNTYSFQDLFLGNIPGSMGEVSALLILIGAAYLFYRRSADFRVTLSTLLSFTVLMGVAAIAVGGNVVDIVLYEILAGGLLFGAVFMVTDPVTSPVSRPGRWIYGLVVGIIVVLIRLFGAYPEGMMFAIILANIFVPLMDYYKWTTNQYSKKFVIGYVVSLAVIAFVIVAGLGGLN